MLKSITKIDFSNQKFISNTPIIEGKYELKGVNQFLKHDSLFILRNLNMISFVTENSQIYRKKNIAEVAWKNTNGVKFIGTSNSRSTLKKNAEIVTVTSTKTNYQNNFFGNLFFMQYNLQKDTLVALPLILDLKVPDNHSFLFRSDPFVLQMDKKAIINFAFTPTIYEFDLENMSIAATKTYASFPANKPVSINDFDFMEDAFKVSKMDYQPYYHPVVYDPYQEKYYRIIRYPNQIDPNSIDFRLELMVMDSNYDFIGKVDLGKEYLPFLFATKEGLFIRLRDQRESYIDLHKLEIKY